ncbi:Transcriptional regulator [Seminavis robusta]|uniref:Transcriptional regulator n=1 Tax=Seminavis robusta TaxID=568900 RepID=A0A9N8E4R2_9STRA|nr:Transcriptional regulator [Seminavis robusta]|eukprot:Sro666_g183950.1 Transcriptional regulator (1182) ;mRNA; f:16978-20523
MRRQSDSATTSGRKPRRWSLQGPNLRGVSSKSWSSRSDRRFGLDGSFNSRRSSGTGSTRSSSGRNLSFSSDHHSRWFDDPNSGSPNAREILRSSNNLSVEAKEKLETLTDLRFSETKLYGREAEIAVLRAAYRRAASPSVNQKEKQSAGPAAAGNGPQVVLIGGPSGTGKTALARQLACTGKLFQGKFDFNHNTPYAALIHAYDSLCKYIVDQVSDVDQETLKAEIWNAFGRSNRKGQPAQPEYNAVVEMIPSLHQLLSDSNANEYDQTATAVNSRTPESSSAQSKNRLVFMFRALTKVLSEFFRPLVLVIDDLQWASSNELDLLSSLVTDSANSNLLFIGTFRDNEVAPNSTVASWLDNLRSKKKNDAGQQHSINLEEICLDNLLLESVNGVISGVLRTEPEHTLTLANTVTHKTGGNPFYVIQFVTTLRDMGLLDYNLGTMKWQWREEEVNKMFVTDNLTEILTLKMRHLDPHCQFVCQLAACLGASFDKALLILAAKSLWEEASFDADADVEIMPTKAPEIVVQGSLEKLLTERILDQGSTKTELQFAHDQIQQSATSLIPDSCHSRWISTIGTAMLDDPDLMGKGDQMLFLAADLCNSAGVPNNDVSPELHQRLMMLNWKAGNRAMVSSAFNAAARYFESGISHLKKSSWSEDYTVPLALHTSAAEAENCNGNFARVDYYTAQILEQDIPFDTKLRPLVSLITSLTIRGNYSESIAIGLDALNQAGMKMPSKASTIGVLTDLIKTRLATQSMHSEKLANLPISHEETRIYVERIIDKLSTATYASQPEYFPFLPLRHVQMCIKKGVSISSPVAFATYAVILCGMLGALQEGYRQGTIAMAMMKHIPDRSCESRMTFLFHGVVAHWVTPTHTNIKPLQDGYNIGMQIGDVESAMYNLFHIASSSWTCGKNLASVEAAARHACMLMDEYSQKLNWEITTLLWQQALNLMGQTDNPLVLDGVAAREENLLKSAKESGNAMLSSLVYSLKMQLTYYMGTPEMMEDLFFKSLNRATDFMSLVYHPRQVFFEGLVAFSLAGHSQKVGKRRKFAKLAHKAKNQIQSWAKAGNVNLTHAAVLLDAEGDVCKGKRERAKRKYENAISLASRSGYQHDCALAHERAALNFLELRDEYWASHHMSNAQSKYLQWGASAKASHLFEEYDYLCSAEKREETTHSHSFVSL